nr:EOG090X08KD [Artemia franciscana]
MVLSSSIAVATLQQQCCCCCNTAVLLLQPAIEPVTVFIYGDYSCTVFWYTLFSCTKDPPTDPPSPDTPSTRKIVPKDIIIRQFSLTPYATKPYCLTVGFSLDWSKIIFRVIEVIALRARAIRWITPKRLPFLSVKKSGGQGSLQSSGATILLNASARVDPALNGSRDLISCFSSLSYVVIPCCGKFLFNEYSLSRGGEKIDLTLKEERKWRRWADSTLVHQLSPNVYRTWEEALQAFKYFSMAGDWENIFPDWQRQIVIYVGALAMYFVGKRLKKRHNLRDDVRQSLYEEVNIWLKALQKKGTPFMGGNAPDLGDLAVYGCLNSIEGCKAFQDLLVNTKIRHWYENMRNAIGHRQGQALLAEY